MLSGGSSLVCSWNLDPVPPALWVWLSERGLVVIIKYKAAAAGGSGAQSIPCLRASIVECRGTSNLVLAHVCTTAHPSLPGCLWTQMTLMSLRTTVRILGRTVMSVRGKTVMSVRNKELVLMEETAAALKRQTQKKRLGQRLH